MPAAQYLSSTMRAASLQGKSLQKDRRGCLWMGALFEMRSHANQDRACLALWAAQDNDNSASSACGRARQPWDPWVWNHLQLSESKQGGVLPHTETLTRTGKGAEETQRDVQRGAIVRHDTNHITTPSSSLTTYWATLKELRYSFMFWSSVSSVASWFRSRSLEMAASS